MAIGMKISRRDGTFFASPDFTPLMLVQVQDVNVQSEIGQPVIGTNVPNGKQCFMFARARDDASAGIYAYVRNGGNGYKEIVVNAALSNISGAGYTVFRFYLFSNFIPWRPRWGVFFFSPTTGEMIYSGNMLPLQVMNWNYLSPAPSGYPCAVIPSLHDFTVEPMQEREYLWTEDVFHGGTNGLDIVPVTVRIVSGVDDSAAVRANCLYIDTRLYDAYYRISLNV
jgi:hypothetical protein